jgi:hypothetical protein
MRHLRLRTIRSCVTVRRPTYARRTALASSSAHASTQRISVAVVQPANFVAVEYQFINFQAGIRKKFGRKLLDREPDSVRGAGKSSVANRFSPEPSALGWEQLSFTPCGEQFRHCAVIKRNIRGYIDHVKEPEKKNKSITRSVNTRSQLKLDKHEARKNEPARREYSKKTQWNCVFLFNKRSFREIWCAGSAWSPTVCSDASPLFMIVGEPLLILGKYGEVKLRPSKSCTSLESFVEWPIR